MLEGLRQPRLNSGISKSGTKERSEATIIRAMIEYGPRNLSKIAKETKIPVETVRYKLKRQLSSLGFRVKAEPDYYKIGLRIYHSFIHYERDKGKDLKDVLDLFAKKGYLIRSVRLLPRDVYSVEFAIPFRTKEICISLLRYLKSKNVISRFQLNEINSMIEYPTRPDFFEIKKARWNIDWQRVKSVQPPNLPSFSTFQAKVDRYDVIMLQELQKDATVHISDIAKKFNIAIPVLGYHYRAHLQKAGLVYSYLVRWTPNYLSRKKRGEDVITTVLDVKESRRNRIKQIHDIVSRIPFIWAEFTTKRNYVAYLQTPARELVNMLIYLNEELSGVKLNLSFSDLTDIAHIPISSELFEGKGWKYDEEKLKAEIDRLISK